MRQQKVATRFDLVLPPLHVGLQGLGGRGQKGTAQGAQFLGDLERPRLHPKEGQLSPRGGDGGTQEMGKVISETCSCKSGNKAKKGNENRGAKGKQAKVAQEPRN